MVFILLGTIAGCSVTIAITNIMLVMQGVQ